MPGLRLPLLVAGVVGLALALLALSCLLTLVHAPVPHSAWRVGLSAVVVTGVWWLLNSPLEGPILVEFTYQHGLTLGDVAALPALLLGGAVLALAVPA
ncbi:hypothetical protein FHN55_20750 [Streptomyces sp. NP160]|uniref:hypothetical protein n=1 Tax=Streptomyces sp. NP160 TaxID=2586637 RepID=UPI0011194C2B|nr:hypothetical protein [Streptomyces sp. NP160]TNM59462.1 hypothetical protein FHN55_20750 [Streptomyces sp. NP160]